MRAHKAEGLTGTILDRGEPGNLGRIHGSSRLVLEFAAHLPQAALQQPATLDDGPVGGCRILSKPASGFLLARDRLPAPGEFVPSPLTFRFFTFEGCETPPQLLNLLLTIGLRFDQRSASVLQSDNLAFSTGAASLQSIEGVRGSGDPHLDRLESL
jgi:hypothetical protein